MRAGRPLGEVSLALLSAASAGPGTVRELAARACVGFDAARFKASDLVRRGALAALTDERPRVLGLPAQAPAQPSGGGGFDLLERSFWERPPGDGYAAWLHAAGED